MGRLSVAEGIAEHGTLGTLTTPEEMDAALPGL
jgi:hypothetical protein